MILFTDVKFYWNYNGKSTVWVKPTNMKIDDFQLSRGIEAKELDGVILPQHFFQLALLLETYFFSAVLVEILQLHLTDRFQIG